MIPILFVDDNLDMLEIGKNILERGGQFLVDTYSYAQEALHALQKGIYEAIISDYSLSDTNGIELLKSIRSSGNKIPFIMFTGRESEEVAMQALNEGADYYLQKKGETGSLFTELKHKILQSISHRQAEVALQESEERFRTLLKNVPAVAVQGYYPDYKVVYWNEANQRIYGYTPEEAIGQDIRELLVPPEARELVSHEVARMVETGIPLAPSEMYLTHKSGTMVPVFSSHAVVNIAGKNPMLFCIDVDLSERKAAEEALLDANRKLNLLSSITMEDISKEMNECIKLLDNAKKNTDISQFDAMLFDVGEHVKKVNQYIEFTKLYQGLGEMSPKWQNLKKSISEFPNINPKIHIDIREFEIYADPSLQKVFSSLLDNSRRYGGRATEIRISDRTIDTDYVIVWEDNGSGIPKKDKERIFGRGYEKQSGIGLHLSREILGITGISIHERGDPEKGARFEILVPGDHARQTKS